MSPAEGLVMYRFAEWVEWGHRCFRRAAGGVAELEAQP